VLRKQKEHIYELLQFSVAVFVIFEKIGRVHTRIAHLRKFITVIEVITQESRSFSAQEFFLNKNNAF